CKLCMGHAVDQTLLSLVKELIADQSAIQGSLDQQRTEQIEIQNTVAYLQDQQSSKRVNLEEHDEQLEALKEQLMKRIKEYWKNLWLLRKP
ncbi:hypothetical protein OS493_036720, partial [Desmophyllum pertusum]